MKKKNLLIAVLAAAAFSVLGVAACAAPNEALSLEQGYAQACALGYTGSVEEFSAAVRTEGVPLQITDVYVNERGELIVRLVGGGELNCGVVRSELCVHSYSESWTVGESETCTSIGYRYRDCSLCRTREYDFPAATGHRYTVTRVLEENACEQDGLALFTCSVCGETQTRVLPAAHRFENGSCTVCGAEKPSEGLAYALNEDGSGYIVTGLGTCEDTYLVIPDTHLGLPVTEIGDFAFKNCRDIYGVKLGGNLVSVGMGAFFACQNLAEITFGSRIQTIGANAFIYCALREVILPDSVNDIGRGAFIACTSLERVRFPQGLGGIKETIFANCVALNEIELPDSVTEIGWGVFINCASLEEIVLPVGLRVLAGEAFRGCDSLKSIDIPDDITQIGASTFFGCESLRSVVLPRGLEYVGKSAFCCCANLDRVYYKGTKAEWRAIEIESGNNDLFNADRFYYAETLPDDFEPPFWHYEDGKATVWKKEN